MPRAWPFLVADGEDPVLLRLLLSGLGGSEWVAFQRLALPVFARGDELADRDDGVAGKGDVVAAGAECVPGGDRQPVPAGMAADLHPACHPPAVQVAVVPPVLVEDVPLQRLQVVVVQHLAGEEAGTAQAGQRPAGGAAARGVVEAGACAGVGMLVHLIPPCPWRSAPGGSPPRCGGWAAGGGGGPRGRRRAGRPVRAGCGRRSARRCRGRRAAPRGWPG